MKMYMAIPAVLVVLGLGACQASAADEHATGGVNINTPAAAVHVGDRSAPGVEVGTRNVGVDVRTPAAPAGRIDVSPPAIPSRGVRAESNLFADNRPDQWRYKWEGNRWWYYGPDNRWMWYSTPGGWTYYEPSGSYTTGYGGEPVAPAPAVAVPPTTTYYYTPGYYYGPGVYFGPRVRGWGPYPYRGRRWW